MHELLRGGRARFAEHATPPPLWLIPIGVKNGTGMARFLGVGALRPFLDRTVNIDAYQPNMVLELPASA